MPTKKASKKVTAKKTAKKAVKKKAAVKKMTKRAAVKKTTRSKQKASAKKTAKKAGASRSKKKQPLVYADDPRAFWVTDGQILNSLIALRDALDEMEQEVYRYHASGGSNDFADWVADVLKDKSCATELAKTRTPRSAKTVVVRHLKRYKL